MLSFFSSILPEFNTPLTADSLDTKAGKIESTYKDLEDPKNRSLRNAVVKKNFRYAAYMYMGLQEGCRYEGDEQGILLSVSARGTSLKRSKIPSRHLPILEIINDQLIKKFGFNIDLEGNYYNTETGIIFNLIYDTERKELVICFMGFNSQTKLNIEEEEQDLIDEASKLAAGADFLRAVPETVRQSIEIGKFLKEITQRTSIKPVLVGHSHGGGLAQAGAVANGLKGVIFNSRPMGIGTRRHIGESTIAKNEKNINAFTVKGDWLTDSNLLSRLGFITEQIFGITVPHNIGNGYYLPRLEDENANNHGRFYDSFKMLKF